jgi:hypothetical protein
VFLDLILTVTFIEAKKCFEWTLYRMMIQMFVTVVYSRIAQMFRKGFVQKNNNSNVSNALCTGE